MLETLRELNPGLPFYSVSDPEFAAYGRVVDGMDLSDLAAAVADLPMPEKGQSAYEPSIDSLEQCEICREVFPCAVR